MTARLPRVLPVLACLALLAGCLGYPPGTARPGDAVTLRYTATDPATGAVLVRDATATATAGHPSGLGPALDRSLVGHKANDTFAVDLPASADYPSTQSVPTDLGSAPMQSVVPRKVFEGQLGPATLGKEFRASQLYNATVVAVDAGNVTYRLTVHDGQEVPVPALGLKLIHYVTGDTLVRTLGALPGTTFGIPDVPNGQTPLGLPPGSYRTRGVEGANLVFDYSPIAPNLFGKAAHLQVQVLVVEPATAPPAVTGEYGHRSSPQLNGDASRFLTTTAAP